MKPLSHLKWYEPRAYRRARFFEQERRNPWDAVKVASVTFLVLVSLRLSAGLGPDHRDTPGWLPALGLAVAVAGFVAYGLPVLLSFVSVSVVLLTEKGVNNNIIGHGVTFHFWAWADIEGCEVCVESAGGHTSQTFSLLGDGGRILATFGLDENLNAAEIDAWLRTIGKRLEGRENDSDRA